MFQKADPVDSVHSDAEEASSSEEDSTPLSKEKKPKISEDKKSKQLIIITHWHKDHSGPAVLWEVGGKKNIASAIKSKSEKDKNPTLVHGQRSPEGAPERSGTLAAELPQHQVKENGEKIYAWKTTPGKNKRDEPKPGELRVEGRAIVPPQLGELKSTAQNTESLGVITVVEKYNATNKKERLFTMVSLGDMEGGTTKRDEEIQTLITEAQERFSSGVPVDVVKISHHGSDKNLKVIPDDLIGKGTTVVISGYTGKASGPLIKKIQEWKKKKAKDVIVLVQDGATVGKLEDMEVAWTNLKPLVTVAKDLIVTADDDGSVVVEATHV
jgi:hypothetical protein